MGGVDKHNKLRSTFSLGKHHNFKKHYVKLMLFLVDVAVTNSWICYKLVHPNECKKSEARADYFLSITQHLVRPGYDCSAKYKVIIDLDEGKQEERLGYLPMRRRNGKAVNDVIIDMDKAALEDKCEFIDFSSVPFNAKKRSKTCQICNYEMQKPKWKGVVMCMNHGV
jgi:hypothetical protein